ncbi:MAG: sigma-70 family RNA polymerase sigma factor [Thermodesulfobacteriota bacterium]|nr:sigma-70 family RNA polymerase sigma factor [Thermodesulfobacteriota bacterium]
MTRVETKMSLANKGASKTEKGRPKCRKPVRDALVLVGVLLGRNTQTGHQYFCGMLRHFSRLRGLDIREIKWKSQDIHQNMVLGLWHAFRRGRLREVRCITGYMRKIVRSRSSDLNSWLFRNVPLNPNPSGGENDNDARHRQAQDSEPNAGQKNGILGASSDALDILLFKERAQLVRKSLAELSAYHRLLVYLRYYLEWSCVLIGARLNITSNTVRVTLYNIRKKLAEAIVLREDPFPID